jgi:predicted MFS family arabinose efflux permease
MNSVYMTTMFLASAIVSSFTGVLMQHWGWPAVPVLGAACALIAAGLWRPDSARR